MVHTHQMYRASRGCKTIVRGLFYHWCYIDHCKTIVKANVRALWERVLFQVALMRRRLNTKFFWHVPYVIEVSIIVNVFWRVPYIIEVSIIVTWENQASIKNVQKLAFIADYSDIFTFFVRLTVQFLWIVKLSWLKSAEWEKCVKLLK